MPTSKSNMTSNLPANRRRVERRILDLVIPAAPSLLCDDHGAHETSVSLGDGTYIDSDTWYGVRFTTCVKDFCSKRTSKLDPEERERLREKVQVLTDMVMEMRELMGIDEDLLAEYVHSERIVQPHTCSHCMIFSTKEVEDMLGPQGSSTSTTIVQEPTPAQPTASASTADAAVGQPSVTMTGKKTTIYLDLTGLDSSDSDEEYEAVRSSAGGQGSLKRRRRD
ncbi:hypothetical protein NMY22_g4651 [Coprinellus aureogranulatus]|nr:hypothetical protein NMY22_g4651 [Coprinellus aureogranulatus]